MPLMLEDLQDNKLYAKQIILPIEEKNKKKGSVIHLLTPSIEESIRIMNNDRFFRNPDLFNAYYMEKDINLIINEGTITVSNVDIVLDEVSLSKYTRQVITDSPGMISVVGIPLPAGCTAVVFLGPDKANSVGHIIYSGSTLVGMGSISPSLDEEILAFGVDVLHLTIAHKDLHQDYKKMLKKYHDYRYFAGKKDGPMIAPGILEETYMEVGGLELLQEGSLKLNTEIAMWKTQVAIVELILKHHENENWMKHNFKAMKAKLSKIPLPGYVRTIDDSLDSLKDELANYKATLSFMTAIAALEAKETFDLSDITAEYMSWVKACKCSKKLKLKIIRELKDSYKETIKTYEYNIKRYEKQSEAKQKLESSLALVGKVSSIFSFLTNGPLGILKSTVMKAILPKSQKQNVLSVEELEAKIDAYSRIILELERLEDEIENESVEESVILSEGKILDLINKYKDDASFIAKCGILSVLGGPIGAIGGILALNSKYNPKAKEELSKLTAKKEVDPLETEILNNLKKFGLDPISKDDMISMAKEDYLEPSKNYQDWMDVMAECVYLNLHEKEKDIVNVSFNWMTFDKVKFCDMRFLNSKNEIVYAYIFCVKKSNKNTLAMLKVSDRESTSFKATAFYIDRAFLRERAAKRRKESGYKESALLESKYSRPYNRKEIETKYGKNKLDQLMKDEAHRFRADTGVELIHQEPTKDELERIMKNWKLMNGVDKKKSDDMSYKLYGMSNEEHYNQLIDIYNEETLSESFIFSKNNLYINIDKFESGKTNVLFITGLSGSGKSTISNSLAAKYNAEIIELDLFEHCGMFSNVSQLQEAGEVFYEYLSSNKSLWERLKKKEVRGKELEEETSKFIKYAIKWCKSHKESKWIIEGVQIYSFTDPNVMKIESIVFVNASMLKSIIQRWKRNGNGKIDLSKEIKNELPQLLRYYIDNEKSLSEFQKAILSEEALLEGNLTADQRKNLSDSDYGLPAKKKYPMPDRDHVKAAIRMFNHVNSQDEKILATAINRKVREFDLEDEITVSKKNRYYNYCPTSMREDAIIAPLREAVMQETTFVRDAETITFFESALVEDTSYNKALRRVLYSERIRNQKEVLLRYESIKQSVPKIKKTYLDISKYNGYNLFVDMGYYLEIFVKNNYLKLDKGINLFFEFINRFLEDNRFKQNGYTKRTVIIPVDCWNVEKDSEVWDYKFNINPISIIYRLIMAGDTYKLKKWAGYDFIFVGKSGFFKLDFGTFDKNDLFRFRSNVEKLIDGVFIEDDGPSSSAKAITIDVLGRLEHPDYWVPETGIKVNNLTGGKDKISKKELDEKIKDAAASSDEDSGMDPEKEAKRIENQEKLLAKVKDVADKSTDTDDAMRKLEQDEEMKQIIADLKMSSPNTVDYSPTRVARINSINEKFLKTKYKDKTIEAILFDDEYKGSPLIETSVPIDSVNEEWKHLKGANLADNYNVNNDIFAVLYHFGQCTVPVAIRDVQIENTSTSEDIIDTWTIHCEDINGKRFTLKFDVPRIINKRFMKLRGNEKVMGNQLMNLPIIKTDLYTTQITSNYNKIFLSPYGNNTGKSFVTSDRLIKALKKYNGKNIKVVTGDNSRVCRKYQLPIDYIDLASSFMTITLIRDDKKAFEFHFNQDTFLEEYQKVDKNKLAFGVKYINGKEEIMYEDIGEPVSSTIAMLLCTDEEFRSIYMATSVSTKYTYSKASIMSSEIPVAVLIGYAIGLIPMLDRAKIEYEITDKRPTYDKSTQDILKLSDAYIKYNLNYDSSLLLNGLKECDLANYSLKEVNSKAMWLDFLDLYGGRIKSDGLDMFYDLMFDPITKAVCYQYDLSDNYIDGLLYANILLSDNKYNKHVDISGNRMRNNEIIAAYVYKALCNSYTQYRRGLKIGREATMTIKQSAVIDLILADNTESDYSSLSPLLEFESANATSFKGLSGMNSERAYGVDKRSYDKSMVNVLAMSTGFAATAGVNRQSTIDPNISTTRGYIKANPDKLNITQTFCMTEALTPYGVTSDDPFRTAMTFTQTSKHGMRTTIGDPLMVTTGADEALVYLTSDTFSHKAKGKGKIKEKTVDYMVIEYDKPIGLDSSGKDIKSEVIDLRERMVKNSDGGFYQSLKLDTDYKVGDIVRENDVVAIDKLSYNNTVGPKDNYAYNIGTFCKFAVVMSDEGFEDSCRSTEWLAKAMSSTVITEQEYNFNKNTNIYYLVKKGQQVQEGEPILIFQNAFEDEDANALIRALKADDEDIVEEIGRITLKSKVTGVVKDIKVRRCVEIDECSPTIQKVIKDYEKSVAGINKALEKYDKDKAKSADPTYKLSATGKLKNSVDSVLITIYIAYQDDFGVSDKTVCYSALKGVSSKEIIPAGDEAFSTFRPDEKIHYIQGEIGDFKRMVGSIFKIGALNKVLVELHRHMCDEMGIEWKYYDEY